MTTDYRALCAELADALHSHTSLYEGHECELVTRARAELSQPEPPAPVDLSHLSDEQFNALAPQGHHGVGDCQPEEEIPTDEDLLGVAASAIEPYESCGIAIGEYEVETECAVEVYGSELIVFARAVLARFGRPAIKPVPVSERFEFSVLNSEYEEQAGGTAPTYIQALSEGERYLSVYSQDGPHTLELRRVQALPHHALPLPVAAKQRPSP